MKKGGLEAQVLDYAPDIWDIFGVNVICVWDLPASYFFSMVAYIDKVRTERRKNR